MLEVSVSVTQFTTFIVVITVHLYLSGVLYILINVIDGCEVWY